MPRLTSCLFILAACSGVLLAEQDDTSNESSRHSKPPSSHLTKAKDSKSSGAQTARKEDAESSASYSTKKNHSGPSASTKAGAGKKTKSDDTGSPRSPSAEKEDSTEPKSSNSHLAKKGEDDDEDSENSGSHSVKKSHDEDSGTTTSRSAKKDDSSESGNSRSRSAKKSGDDDASASDSRSGPKNDSEDAGGDRSRSAKKDDTEDSSKADSQPSSTATVVTPLDVADLRDYDQNPPAVRTLIGECLPLTHQNLGYKYGSSDPADGGMDCSGTIFYVLRSVGLDDVPRTASGQYVWARKADNFEAVVSRKKDSFELDGLKPGDLLFWTGTYTTDRDPPVTHTMIYLGKLKSDGRQVMFGSSDGRTYGGKKMWGVSVFDFTIPKPKEKGGGPGSVFIGYAAIPGLDKAEVPKESN